MCRANSLIAPGHLDTGRPAADDDECQIALAGVGSSLGVLECRQHAAANLGCFLNRLEPRCMHLPFRFAEIVVHGAGSDDEAIEWDSLLAEQHSPAGNVKTRDFTKYDAAIMLSPEHGTQRRRNIGRRQAARGDLVQKRLEQMKVAAIDQGDVDVGATQRLRRGEPAESAADNDDLVAIGHWQDIPHVRVRMC